MTVVLSFAMALFLATVTLPLCMRYAAWLGLMDVPGAARKVHEQIVPRSGGIAIVVGSLVAAAWWVPLDASILPFAGAVAIIIAFGYLDDRFELSSRHKMIGQCVAAGLFLLAYGGLPHVPFLSPESTPGWVPVAWSFLFIVGVTNAINLSDGLDGLAAGNSLLSILLLAFLATYADRLDYAAIALALAGGLLGFLRFNTHPARLFMGDTGSQFLGFTAAALAALILREETLPVSPLLPVLIFGLPILDTLSVMAVRAFHGRPLFQADRSHLHHQLLGLGFEHYEVVAIMYGLQAVAVTLAYVLRYESDATLLLVYGAYCATILGTVGRARTSGWLARPAEHDGPPVERRNLWLRRLGWYHSRAAVIVAACVAVIFACSVVLLPVGSRAVGEAAAVCAIALVFAAVWLRGSPALTGRLATYIAVAFIVHQFAIHMGGRPTLNLAVDAAFVILALLLTLAIRLTRSAHFRLDTQDLLVLLIVAAVPLLPLEQFDAMLVAQVAFRALVLFYACEFVVCRGDGSRTILTWAAIGSLGAIAAGGLS